MSAFVFPKRKQAIKVDREEEEVEVEVEWEVMVKKNLEMPRLCVPAADRCRP